MSVEANAAATFDAPLTTESTSDMDAQMGAVWDKMERDNGASRGEGGRFASDRAAGEGQGANADAGDGKEPLEGGGGEEGADAVSSTPADAVPLPPSLRGLDDVWKEIPAHLQRPLAEHQAKLHKTLSEQGQQLSTFKPIGDTIQEFKDYFGGPRGNYQPAEAIKELFTIQRSLDDNPLGTWMEIAKRYDLLPQLAKLFTGQSAEGGDGAAPTNTENAALLAEVGELKRTIADMASKADPSKMDERISQRLMEDRELTESRTVISRVSKDMPLLADIPEDDMVLFINRAWQKLGETATKDAVFKAAYDNAINADPDLRVKAAALKSAAAADPNKVAEAKRANATNIRSTSTGKPRDRTEDELLADVWDRTAKG